MTITFWTNPMSRGRIVRWMLEELGQPYETVVLAYGPEMKSPDYLAVNPMGKVPAIRHDGRVVTEAAAICAYLAEAFPQAGLQGEDRAAFFRWLFFAAGPVEQAVTLKSLGVTVPAEREGTVGFGTLSHVLDALETAVSAHPYIAGEAFSAADVYVGSQIGWGMMFGTIEPRPALVAYWDRLKDRPARLRADEMDNALMPKKEG
ncbi:MAG: glutathione S-transferase family protein [Paracoccaceae bacterium]|nr:glutathione S-transferase family protein [Paracoccaceae bacterium]